MQPDRLLRLPQVMERVPGCRAWIYARIAEGTFPKPIRIGRSAFWSERHVNSWIEAHVAAAAKRDAAE